MELRIRGHEVNITDDLLEFAERRTNKLSHLIDHVVEAKLELRRRHQRTGGDSITAQITIQTGRDILRAEEHDREAHVAIDKAVDKLDRRVRRVHERRTDRKGPRPDLTPSILEVNDVDEDLDDETEGETTITRGLVRTKRFTLKPMDIDEAIEQMELLGHDFFLFQNASESHLNVVYRRIDGSYGLLAPIK